MLLLSLSCLIYIQQCCNSEPLPHHMHTHSQHSRFLFALHMYTQTHTQNTVTHTLNHSHTHTHMLTHYQPPHTNFGFFARFLQSVPRDGSLQGIASLSVNVPRRRMSRRRGRRRGRWRGRGRKRPGREQPHSEQCLHAYTVVEHPHKGAPNNVTLC